MNKRFERFDRIYGTGASDYLSKKKILIFGVGGVGSYAAEALARCGIGHLTIVDADVVDITNINRQIEATEDVLGKNKVEVLKRRLELINPIIEINELNIFYDENHIDEIDFISYDYVIDAIDSIESKLLIISMAKYNDIRLISSMGMGNKIYPSHIKISDIKKTHTCPLARVMRRKLKDMGICKLDVVWSDEIPIKPVEAADKSPGSTAFVPSVAGLYIASHVVNELIRSDCDGEIRDSIESRRVNG